jgi:hypothetical protein
VWLGQSKSIYRDVLTDETFYADAERPIDLRARTVEHWVSVKYGNTTPCVFLDIYDDGETVFWDREWVFDAQAEWRQKSDAEYADDLAAFMGAQTTDQRQWPGILIEPELGASLKRELLQRGMYVMDAKNDAKAGIRKVTTMLARKKIRINKESCPRTCEEMQTYSWDKRGAERGEDQPANANSSGPDAGRYHAETRVNDWRLAQ